MSGGWDPLNKERIVRSVQVELFDQLHTDELRRGGKEQSTQFKFDILILDLRLNIFFELFCEFYVLVSPKSINNGDEVW